MKNNKLLICLLLAALLLAACALAAANARANTEKAADAATVPPAEVPTEAAAAAASWDGLEFETTDLEGNAITARELFSAHAYTMVNVWASWCPPCVRELPELQRLSEAFAEKDCAIVGLLLDGDEAQGLNDGIARLEEAGATYTILLPWEDWIHMFPASAVPTSYFVDRDGHIVGEPVVGAYPEKYAAVVDALLAQTEG